MKEQIYYHSAVAEAFARDGKLRVRPIKDGKRGHSFVLLEKPGEADTFCQCVMDWRKDKRS